MGKNLKQNKLSHHTECSDTNKSLTCNPFLTYGRWRPLGHHTQTLNISYPHYVTYLLVLLNILNNILFPPFFTPFPHERRKMLRIQSQEELRWLCCHCLMSSLCCLARQKIVNKRYYFYYNVFHNDNATKLLWICKC